MIKYFVVILFFSCSALSGQDSGSSITENDLFIEASDVNFKVYGIEQYDHRDKTTEGSAFLNDQWNRGIIKLANDKELDQYLFKYNIKDQELIIKFDNKFVSPPREFVKSFVIQIADLDIGTIFSRSFKKVVNDKSEVAYYEVLEQGEITLLRLFKVTLVKANYVPALDAGQFKDKLVKKEKYFFGVGEDIIEIPKKRKKAIQKLKSFRKISNYLERNKINTSKESDLRNATIAMNSVLN